jgi:ribosomal protein S12 methylthiotransferase accessory factor YcaO
VLADTYTATNSEAYTAALRVYNSAKSNATLPGMKIVVEELKQQFARRNQKAIALVVPEGATPNQPNRPQKFPGHGSGHSSSIEK